MPVPEQFTLWLETVHPELGDFSSRIWFPYMTCPQIWIVEHWTFPDEDWEFRLCYHVTIPPYDWSKIMLRRRGEWNPVLAAMRETDGIIHEIRSPNIAYVRVLGRFLYLCLRPPLARHAITP